MTFKVLTLIMITLNIIAFRYKKAIMLSFVYDMVYVVVLFVYYIIRNV